MARVWLVIGPRPELIKQAPVAAACAAAGLECGIVMTGQHPGLPAPPRWRGPVVRLGIEHDPDPPRYAARLARALVPIFAARTAAVLVQGDTASSLAGARAAVTAGAWLGHVEAGLRSHDRANPWPEEDFRIEIDALADHGWAATPGNAAHLAAEAVRGSVSVVGNSGIDALLARLARLRLAPAVHTPGDPFRILVTCHRRENWPALDAIATALAAIVAEGLGTVRLVLHPNPALATRWRTALADVVGIELLPPLGPDALLRELAAATLVLSDSGGIQEEAPALGRPLLVLREATERAEAIAAGHARLVGSDPDRILAAVRALHADPAAYAAMARPGLPFGDGRTGPRIAAELRTMLAARARLTPAPAPAIARLPFGPFV